MLTQTVDMYTIAKRGAPLLWLAGHPSEMEDQIIIRTGQTRVSLRLLIAI